MDGEGWGGGKLVCVQRNRVMRPTVAPEGRYRIVHIVRCGKSVAAHHPSPSGATSKLPRHKPLGKRRLFGGQWFCPVLTRRGFSISPLRGSADGRGRLSHILRCGLFDSAPPGLSCAVRSICAKRMRKLGGAFPTPPPAIPVDGEGEIHEQCQDTPLLFIGSKLILTRSTYYRLSIDS